MNDSIDGVNYDPYKIVLLGNSKVGKTSFYTRFAENTFDHYNTSTFGIDVYNHKVTIKNNNILVNLAIWDTAGQERFRSIGQSYYKNANGFLVIYDITDNKSFDDLNTWIASIKEKAPKNIKIIIIGNKVDLDNKRVITLDQGTEIAKANGCGFYETSAKENINIDEVITQLATDIYDDLLINNKKTPPTDVRSKRGTTLNDSSKNSDKHANKQKCCSNQ